MQPSGAIIAAATSLGACFLLWASYPHIASPYDTLSASLDLHKVLDVASSSLSWSSTQADIDDDFQISTYNQTFPEFLSQYPEDDLIWLTLADKFFSQTCTTHLQHFVKSLPPYTPPVQFDNNTSIATQKQAAPRKHRLITLCIDPGCMQTCAAKNWTCYGEYELSRPEIIFPSTWPKLAGEYYLLTIYVFRTDTTCFIRPHRYIGDRQRRHFRRLGRFLQEVRVAYLRIEMCAYTYASEQRSIRAYGSTWRL